MTDSEKLTLALQLLAEIHALFRDTLKREPASDWYVDVDDFTAHPGITPEQRLDGVLRLLATGYARIEQLDPAGTFASAGGWQNLRAATSGLLATRYSLPATSGEAGGPA